MTLNNEFQCARCKVLSHYSAMIIPGPGIGSLVIDQPACLSCYNKHHDYMERFWGEASRLRSQNCPKCGEGLTRHNSKPAYRRASDGKTVDMDVICDVCHSEYSKYCASAAKK